MDNGQLIMDNYPAMKDSCIDWLGKIPAHWEMRRIKYLFREVDNRSTTGKEELLSLSKYHGLIPRSEITDKLSSAETLVGYKKCSPGELVLNKLQAWNGMFDISSYDGLVSPDYSVFAKTKPLEMRYFRYLFRTSLYVSEFRRKSSGIGEGFFRLYTDAFFRIWSILPPLPEQTAITNFLDRKTAQIDQFVTLKKQTIALLQEQKTAIINRAVTQGLNPDVPMKDSGIEWLRAIPAHWEVKKLKFLTKKIGSGVTPRGGATTYQPSGIPLIRSQNVHFDRIDLQEVAYISEDVHREMTNSRVASGDVLLNITGGSLGRCYYVTNQFSEANVNQHVCIVRPNRKITSKHLNYLLASGVGQSQIWFFQQGGGREGLNFQNLKNFYFAIPAPSEQNQIVAYIEQATAKIDSAIAQAQQQIALIKEYRESLISQAVTGKIKIVDD